MAWELFTEPQGVLWFALVLLNIGAVYRVCRFIARDTLLEPTRQRLAAKYHGMLINLMLCMWCLSFWFAIGAVLLTVWDTTRDAWLVIATMLSVSTAVGYMSERA